MCVQTHKKFWDSWHEFEVRCGNEDTFRDMLRTKRSVQAVFSTKVCVFGFNHMVAIVAYRVLNTVCARHRR